VIELAWATPSEWADGVLANMDTFLLDHAACERKASATAMAFVSHYPDRPDLVRAMIALAQEELEHFRQVWLRVEDRNLVLKPDTKDRYVRGLRKHIRDGTELYLLDRLVVAAVVEARGQERFGLIADALPSGDLKRFYALITRSEALHAQQFLDLADRYFDRDTVRRRLQTLLAKEAEIISALPFRPALH
jgi:tRNA 2-(methylsulfanyl)-N6-isopentenyladenosine37 hydroxylase